MWYQDAYQILKYHGSYQQDDREKRTKGQQKAYSFMLRLKMPCGEVPANLHLKLDELCDTFGQQNLRATTRQAYQMHGVLKGDLKTVVSTLMEMGSSTVGACGDVSRNVMCTPAPKVRKQQLGADRGSHGANVAGNGVFFFVFCLFVPPNAIPL